LALQREQGRHEGACAAVASAVDDGSCDGDGGATTSGGVAGGGGANEIDEARKDACELEGDGEEGPNGGVFVRAAR
jgi:hypothetical protein